MKQYKVAILGATGAVGREMMKILAERNFPVSELHLDRHITLHKSLGISIADNETATLDLLVVHIGDGIAPATAHTEHLDHRVLRNPVARSYYIGRIQIVRHNHQTVSLLISL